MPYADATFDAVYAVSVIGEIPDRERAFRQIARVLAPRGRLVVAEHFLDPDYVSSAALTQAGADAGLELEERLGRPRSYFARLRKPG